MTTGSNSQLAGVDSKAKKAFKIEKLHIENKKF